MLNKLYEAIKLVFGKYPSLSEVDYNEYWKDKRKVFGKITNFQKRRSNIIVKHLGRGSLKDIGCGEGSILLDIVYNSDLLQVYGVDISEDALDSLKYKGIRTILADITKIPELPETDYTLVLETFEHVYSPEKLIKSLLETTRSKLIFSVPNTGYFAHRLRLLFGSFPLQWRLNPSEHIRFWTYRDMKWWLRQLNLNGKIVLYEGLPILNKIFPSIFSQGMVVIIKK